MTIVKKLISDGELKKEFDVILPIDMVKSSLDEEATKIQKNYRLDGFRPGKVPVDVIKSREKENLFYRVCENLINDTTFNISEENKYELALQPKVDIKVLEEDKDINFVATFEIMPKIPVNDYKNIKLDFYKVSIGDDDVEKSTKKILDGHKNWTKKDGSAELKDSVKIDFVGKIDGVEFDGGKGENYQLELGSHSFIDNFEDQLVGKKAGDEVSVKVNFPDNYHRSALAGKPAVFEVKINEVLSPEPAVLNDEFVNKYFGASNAEEFRNILRKELENTYTNLSRDKLKDGIIKYIEDKIIFPVPEGILNERFDRFKTEEEKANLKNGNKEAINEEKIKKDAENASRVGMFLSKLGKDENINITEEEITEEIMKSASSMVGYEKMIIDFYKKNRQALENLKNQLLEEKILNFIVDNIEKNEIDISVDEFENIIKEKSKK